MDNVVHKTTAHWSNRDAAQWCTRKLEKTNSFGHTFMTYIYFSTSTLQQLFHDSVFCVCLTEIKHDQSYFKIQCFSLIYRKSLTFHLFSRLITSPSLLNVATILFYSLLFLFQDNVASPIVCIHAFSCIHSSAWDTRI